MADEFDEHGQCVVCFENLSTAEPGKAFPCCGATYCPACARETVENECCAECFKEIDAQGDVEGYVAALPAHDAAPPPPPSPTPSEAPTEPSAPPRPTARELRQQRSRLEKIDQRARRLAAHTDVTTVDLAGDACPGPEAVRAAFDRDEVLAASDVLCLLKRAVDVLAAEPNVLGLQAPLLTIGDIHGQYGDLEELCHGDGDGGALLQARRDCGAPEALGGPPASGDDKKVGSLLFLGDYVDRGARSCEVLFYLLALKVRYPRKVHLLRGNHESRNCTGHFGFRDECNRKYGPHVYNQCCSVFEAMPLAAVVATGRGDIFCCHGGLGPDLRRVADLNAIDRRVEPEDKGLLCDILWSDPRRDDEFAARRTTLASFDTNPTRGCSVVFGETAVDRFLRNNDLLAMIRAHECQEAGLAQDFDDTVMPFESLGEHEILDGDDRVRKKLARVTTVFSAADYCGHHGGTQCTNQISRRRLVAEKCLLAHPTHWLICSQVISALCCSWPGTRRAPSRTRLGPTPRTSRCRRRRRAASSRRRRCATRRPRRRGCRRRSRACSPRSSPCRRRPARRRGSRAGARRRARGADPSTRCRPTRSSCRSASTPRGAATPSAS